MIRRLFGVLILCVLILPLTAQDTEEARILSISVVPPLDPPPTADTFVPLYLDTLKIASEAGVTAALLQKSGAN